MIKKILSIFGYRFTRIKTVDSLITPEEARRLLELPMGPGENAAGRIDILMQLMNPKETENDDPYSADNMKWEAEDGDPS